MSLFLLSSLPHSPRLILQPRLTIQLRYWHRFTKFSAYGPSNFTGVVQTRAKPTDFFANDWELVFQGIGDAEFGQVEGPLVFKDNVEAGTYHVWVDKISPQGYEPFSTSE